MLFVLTFVVIEGASAYSLRKINVACATGDLVRYDTTIACKSYRRFGNVHEKMKELDLVERPVHKWKDIRDSGPYDVVLFGDSTANRAWVPLIREALDVRIANIAVQKRAIWPAGFIHLAKHYDKINSDQKSIWLYVGITEQKKRQYFQDYTIRDLIDHQPEEDYADQQFRSVRRHFFFKSTRLWFYIKNWYQFRYRRSEVLVKKFGDAEHLVIRRNWDGLRDTGAYTPFEYDALKLQFQEAKNIAAEHGGVLVYAAMPSKLQLYDWLMEPESELRYRKHTTAIKRITHELGIPFLDLEEELKPMARDFYEREKKLFWLPADTHMNLEGAIAVKQVMQSFLGQLLPQL